MMMNFNEVLNKVKESDLKVLTEGETYFTVENGEGYRAYCQVNTWKKSDLEDTNYYQGYDFSTVHKPNRKTGTGWREITEAKVNNESDLFRCLDQTLERSKMKIQSGKERMDTRQPKNGFLW